MTRTVMLVLCLVAFSCGGGDGGSESINEISKGEKTE